MARRPEALPARKRPSGASQSGAVRKKRHSAPRRGAQRLRSAIATPGAGRWPSRLYRRARARRPTRLCARRPGGGWIPPGRARGRGAAATMGRERTSCPAARARRRKCLNPQTAKPGSLHATSFVKSALLSAARRDEEAPRSAAVRGHLGPFPPLPLHIDVGLEHGIKAAAAPRACRTVAAPRACGISKCLESGLPQRRAATGHVPASWGLFSR